MLADGATGYPGYFTSFPRSAATIAEILKDNGYNTAFFGKHHNVPAWQISAAGPFDQWPTGLGFEYFFGFVAGDSNQWHAKLYRGTDPLETQSRDPNQLLDQTLADDAIRWIHNQKAGAPDKPFFAYYATGSNHAPHQAPADWIARFKGKFDQGWDKVREETYQRQKALGIIPPTADLTPRPAALPAWDTLTASEKTVYARYMEVYAAMMAYEDDQIGRIFDELNRMGQLDNTLVIFIEGDNGASGEAGPQGTTNELGELASNVTSDPAELVGKLDDMGGPHTYELYPAGWAWAMNTPFQWMKQIASHLGGVRNGLVVSWPRRIMAHGEIRSQFTHLIDIFPTILEAAGLPAPTIVNGTKQQRIDGISLAYTFDRPDAQERHQTQYFEMLGNRAIYHQGWMASTTPRRMPWSQVTPPGNPATDYKWELYDLRSDYSQAHDLATAQPAKLKAMQDLWWAEAEKNNVLPLDDRFGMARSAQDRAEHAPSRTDFTYWGKDISVSLELGPNFVGRSFSVTANVSVPDDKATGVLVAAGSWFGGWSFYLKDGRPAAFEAFSQKPQEQYRVISPRALQAGPAVIRYDFAYDGGGLGRGGIMHISVNGEEVAQGRIERTITLPAGNGETFDIGWDTGTPVTADYPDLGRYPGDIAKVDVHLEPFALAPAVTRAGEKAKAGSE